MAVKSVYKNKVVLYFPVSSYRFDPSSFIFEPLSLLCLSRTLCSADFDVQIIDGRVETCDTLDIVHCLDGALCVGVSARIDQVNNGLLFSSMVKQHNKELKVIWGGWNPTTLTKITLNNPLIDIVVRGQGEISFLELVTAIAKNSSFEGIPGISYKLNGKIVNTPERPVTNPEQFGSIPYSILKKNKKYLLSNGILYYLSSIGCPNHCTFCSIPCMYQKEWHGLNAETIIKDLENIQKETEFKKVLFFDDNFFVNIKRVKMICNMLINSNLQITWEAHACINSVTRFDDEFLSLLKSSGCFKLWLGVESSSKRMLSILHKNYSDYEIESAVKKLYNYNINTTINMIFDLPHETSFDVNQSIATLRKIFRYNPGASVNLYKFFPMPGTPLKDELVAAGKFLEPTSIEKWAQIFALERSWCSPWIDKDSSSRYASKTFYAWFSFRKLDKSYITSYTILLMVTAYLSRIRFAHGIFFFPFEYWINRMAYCITNFLKKSSKPDLSRFSIPEKTKQESL